MKKKEMTSEKLIYPRRQVFESIQRKIERASKITSLCTEISDAELSIFQILVNF